MVMSQPIYIAHANGFPGGSYRVLSDYLSLNHQVYWCDMLAHQARYPVSDNWPHLVDELIANLQGLGQGPVHLVGHSLGGALGMQVADARPDLLASLTVLDSPFLTPSQSFSLRLSKRTGLHRWFLPIERTRVRQQSWATVDEAIKYFQGKRLMRDFDGRCLRDYVAAATEVRGQQIVLRYQPDIEAEIWSTIPDNFSPKKPFVIPSAVLAGRSSRVFSQANARLMRKRLGMEVVWFNGSHLFPFEKPDQTAAKIHQLISQWGVS